MKLFIVLAIVCSVFCIVTSAALSPEEQQDMDKKVLFECKDKEGASEDDINTIMDRQVPTNPKAKCLLACAHETIGLVKGGKVSLDGLKALAVKKFGEDEKIIATITDIFNDCESIDDSDRCELAAKYMECSMNAAIKRGIDPKKGFKQ